MFFVDSFVVWMLRAMISRLPGCESTALSPSTLFMRAAMQRTASRCFSVLRSS